MSTYTNYFKNHFNISVSEKDITTYRQWFLTQWNFIQGKIKLKKNTKVLEIGSGLGIFYSFIEPIIGKDNYSGLELDSDTCTFTNTFFKTKNFKNIPIEKLISKDKYTLVAAFEVLEHIEDPMGVIHQIHELLSDDGVFVGTSPFPYPKNIYADETHRYVLHPSNWEKLFKESSFSDVKTFPMSFLPFVWRIHPVFNVRIPWYIPFPYFISTTLIIARK